MRRCGRCGELKPIEDFAWRRKEKGERQSHCRKCQSAYHRQHYLANKERYIAQARDWKATLRLERTRFLFAYFAEHPCSDCGETDPVVLEFDHLSDKAFDIGQSLSYRRWETILSEMEKCEVVCRNCHRRRESRRSGTVRHLLAEQARRPRE